MKQIILHYLAWCATRVRMRYQPVVVSISGTVGKTTTKDAVAAVLTYGGEVWATHANENMDFGVVCTLLGVPVSRGGVFEGVRVVLQATLRVVTGIRNPPRYIVVEFGSDKPGDNARLVALCQPTIAVVTRISHAHSKFFSSLHAIAHEESYPALTMPRGGHVVMPDDDQLLREEARTMGATIHWAGSDDGVHADGIGLSLRGRAGMGETSFRLHDDAREVEVRVPGVVSTGVVQAFTLAATVAKICNIPLHACAGVGGRVRMQPGRMRVLGGIKHSVLIDDTYNASPEAMRMAFHVLTRLANRPPLYMIIGDMRELGDFAPGEHEGVGALVPALNPELVIVVGEHAEDYARGILTAGFDMKKLLRAPDSATAGKLMQERMPEGVLVFLKASRGVHLEHAVKELMAEPMRAHELIVMH